MSITVHLFSRLRVTVAIALLVAGCSMTATDSEPAADIKPTDGDAVGRRDSDDTRTEITTTTTARRTTTTRRATTTTLDPWVWCADILAIYDKTPDAFDDFDDFDNFDDLEAASDAAEAAYNAAIDYVDRHYGDDRYSTAVLTRNLAADRARDVVDGWPTTDNTSLETFLASLQLQNFTAYSAFMRTFLEACDG